MSDDHLSNTRERSLEDDSKTSEAELHSNNESILAGWQEIQDLRAFIAIEKQTALNAINVKYAPRLCVLESEYAMLVTLTR